MPDDNDPHSTCDSDVEVTGDPAGSSTIFDCGIVDDYSSSSSSNDPYPFYQFNPEAMPYEYEQQEDTDVQDAAYDSGEMAVSEDAGIGEHSRSNDKQAESVTFQPSLATGELQQQQYGAR